MSNSSKIADLGSNNIYFIDNDFTIPRAGSMLVLEAPTNNTYVVTFPEGQDRDTISFTNKSGKTDITFVAHGTQKIENSVNPHLINDLGARGKLMFLGARGWTYV